MSKSIRRSSPIFQAAEKLIDLASALPVGSIPRDIANAMRSTLDLMTKGGLRVHPTWESDLNVRIWAEAKFTRTSELAALNGHRTDLVRCPQSPQDGHGVNPRHGTSPTKNGLLT